MKSVIQILCSGDSFPGTDRPLITHCRAGRGKYKTHKPILAPTASMNPHACCVAFASCVTESLPRCFSDRYSTSAGVKYGWWYFEDDAGIWDGDGALP